MLRSAQHDILFSKATAVVVDDKPMHEYYVYILTNHSGTLYTGVTNDLVRRLYEHKNKLVPGFTGRYNLHRLVYYESCSDIRAAITRENEIKGWVRSKKVRLIETINPEWNDLSKDW